MANWRARTIRVGTDTAGAAGIATGPENAHSSQQSSREGVPGLAGLAASPGRAWQIGATMPAMMTDETSGAAISPRPTLPSVRTSAKPMIWMCRNADARLFLIRTSEASSVQTE
jgi:hypothetical protein